MDIGGELQAARKARMVSIDDISRATKIRPSILRAIESNAFDRIPGGIFTRGYLSAYAREVGLDPDDVVQRFHRHVARAMLDAGALRMYAMRSGERVVAVFYGFADATTVYYYLSGYDPDLEKLSPGTLIVAHAIECARRDGATAFDFLRGAEDYKYSWGAKNRMNRRRQLIRG